MDTSSSTDRRRSAPTTPGNGPLERVTTRDVEKLAPAGVFGYAAGKSIIARKLVSLFPAHKTYVEPFCGSAALFFTKEAADREVLNDLRDEVMDAYKAIQKLSEADAAKLEAMKWVGSKRYFQKLQKSTPDGALEKLYKFLYVNHFAFGKGKNGSFRPDGEGRNAGVVKRVLKGRDRLKGVTLLNGDYEKVLRKYDGADTFFFLDPPYPGTASWGGVGESEFDEARFRKALERIKGKFLVTYGTTGKLDTSGFEVKRMRQDRTIARIAGSKGSNTLTHLLISNFGITKKSLGGYALDDVVAVMDSDASGDRLALSGSRTSVSVPADLMTKSTSASVIAADGATWIVFAGNAGWSIDAPLHKLDGATAQPRVFTGLAIEKSALGAHELELGTHTGTVREYFVTKGDVLTGVLKFEALGEAMPWLVTYCDRWPSALYDFPVLKAGAPMPPHGHAALPESLTKSLPESLRFWEKTGAEAARSREALALSKLLAPEGLAIVDGTLERIEKVFKLAAPTAWAETDPGWTTLKAAELVDASGLGGGGVLKLVDHAPKAPDEVLFKEIGEAETFAAPPSGEFVLAAPTSKADELAAFGPVFKFRPGDGVGLEALDRVFVTSLPVRLDVAFVGKAEWTTAYVNDLPDAAFLFIEAGGEKDEQGKTKPRSLRHFPYKDASGAVDAAHARNAIARIPQSNAPGLDAGRKQALQDKARAALASTQKAVTVGQEPLTDLDDNGTPRRKPTLTTPSDDTPDLGKRDVAKILEHRSDGWHVMSGDGEKHLGGPYSSKAQAVERLRQVEGHKEEKAEFNNPDPGGPGDIKTGGPGFLRPAQGNPYQRRNRYAATTTTKAFAILDKANDERIVTGIVLEPDTVDAQQDVYSAEEVRAAAYTYMEKFQNAGFMHRKEINDKAKVIESYLAPVDFSLGGQKVKKGTWVMSMRVLDSVLWKEIKSDGLTGFSIGGTAQRTPESTSKAMRKTTYQGIPITVDRPKGYVQEGRNEEGQPWSREYKVDYGYIPRTKGGDGEGLDVFLGPNPDAPQAFWVAQKKGDGSFDEYKVILGADNPAQAKAIYLDHVPEKYFGEMHAMGVEHMKSLLNQEPDHKMQPEGWP